MAFPSSTHPRVLHLAEWMLETAQAMQALERRTVRVTGKLPADHRTTAQMLEAEPTTRGNTNAPA